MIQPAGMSVVVNNMANMIGGAVASHLRAVVATNILDRINPLSMYRLFNDNILLFVNLISISFLL